MPAGPKSPRPDVGSELRAQVLAPLQEACGALVDASALLKAADDPERLVARLRQEVTQGAAVACFGVLERFTRFGVVVQGLVALAAERDATVVIGVPNAAFAGEDAPGDGSMWGEGAVAELRGLLPAGHVLLHEVALRGAALVPTATPAAGLVVPVAVDEHVPTGFVMAFGPHAGDLAAAAVVAPVDLVAERAVARRQTAELEVLRARLAALEPAPEPVA